MKRILITGIGIIAMNIFLASCSKCAVCKVSGQESNKICQKDSRSNYKDSKIFCESSGGVWEEL